MLLVVESTLLPGPCHLAVLPLCWPHSTGLETSQRSVNASPPSSAVLANRTSSEPEQMRYKQGLYSPLPALRAGTLGNEMEQMVGAVLVLFLLFFLNQGN